MSLSRIRLVLWVVVGLVAAAVVVLLWRQAEPPGAEQTALGPIGGPFTLTGTDGKPFASSSAPSHLTPQESPDLHRCSNSSGSGFIASGFAPARGSTLLGTQCFHANTGRTRAQR